MHGFDGQVKSLPLSPGVTRDAPMAERPQIVFFRQRGQARLAAPVGEASQRVEQTQRFPTRHLGIEYRVLLGETGPPAHGRSVHARIALEDPHIS